MFQQQAVASTQPELIISTAAAPIITCWYVKSLEDAVMLLMLTMVSSCSGLLKNVHSTARNGKARAASQASTQILAPIGRFAQHSIPPLSIYANCDPISSTCTASHVTAHPYHILYPYHAPMPVHGPSVPVYPPHTHHFNTNC